MDLKEKAKKLPFTPGVYLMKDSLGNVIYVGKAKKLKQRVLSYFQDSKNHSKKVKNLVQTIDNFEIIHTDTEFEAFLLECDLIKKIKPFFNRRMKNPQNYPYIALIKGNGIRKFVITNNPNQYKENKADVFGPYSSKNTVEKAMHVIKNSYKINCGNLTKRNSLCTNHSLGMCLGVCRGDNSVIEQYEQQIDQIILLLNGKDKRIIDEIRRKMLSASGIFDFENASKYRDELNALEGLLKKEKLISFIEKQKNIVVIEHLYDNQMKLFLLKGNKLLLKERYQRSIDAAALIDQIHPLIIPLLKENKGQAQASLQQNEIDETQIIYHYIQKNKYHLMIPQKWIESKDHARLAQALRTFFYDSLTKQ